MEHETILNELRLQFSRIMEVKEKLDNKTNSMMGIAGTMATLLGGFGVLLFDKLDLNYVNTNYVAMFFISSIIAFVITIVFTILAHLLRNYSYPYDESTRIKDGNADRIWISKIGKLNEKQFLQNLIANYLECLNNNTKSNSAKTIFLTYSHYFFLAGIISMVILVIFIVDAFYKQALSPISL